MRVLASFITMCRRRRGDSSVRWRQRLVTVLLAAFAPACIAQDSARGGPLYDELARQFRR